MSLIHWWSLNEDLKDKITLSTVGGTYNKDSNGKTGDCLKSSYPGFQTSVQLVDEWSHWKHSVSMSCWVKLNYDECNNYFKTLSYSSTTPSPTGCLIGQTSYGGLGIHWYTNNMYNNGTIVDLTTISFRGYTRGSGSIAVTSNFTVEFDKWYHMTLVADYDKKVLKFYVNGSQIGADTSYASIPEMTDVRYFGWGRGEIWSGNGPSGYLPMRINDIRLYDHALSQAEVKELSKALVVHYTFNDVLAEPTTNVSTISDWNSYTSYFVISEKTETSLKIYRPTSSTNTVLALNNSTVTSKMTAGDIWTFSCYLYVDGKPYKCTEPDMSTYNYSGISYYSNDDGYYTCTFTVGTPDTWIIHAPMLGSVGTNVMCEIDKIQFEKKDHATPYTPSSRESMIIDESGYNHPTTLVNDCTFTTDTNSGTLSLHTAGTSSSTAHASCSYLKCDVGTLITPTEFTVSFNAKVNLLGVQNSGILSFNIASSEPTEYMASTFVQYDSNFRLNKAGDNTQSNISYNIITLNEWHHYAFVWDGTNLIGYKDGVQYGTAQSASFTVDPFRYIYLGYDRAGGAGRNADVTWGDFRFYNTALTSSDIKDLYQTKAYISDKGDIMCNEFIEGKSQAQVTSKSIFEADEFYEEIDEGYEVLEYIESTGTQYIKTGINNLSNITKIKAHYYQTTYNKSQILYGCYDGVATMYFNYKESSDRNHACHWYTVALLTSSSWTANQENETELLINGNSLTYTANGISINATASTRPTTSYDTYLFAYNNRGTAGYAYYCKLYDFEIWVDNKLVRKFVPMKRKSDGVLGLYDIANKTFYTNAGTGTFVAGPTLTNSNASIYATQNVSGRNIIEI